MLTVSQVAALCGVSPITVRGWINRGKIRRNHRGFIENEDLINWWDRQRNANKARAA